MFWRAAVGKSRMPSLSPLGCNEVGAGSHLGPGTRSPALLQPSDLCTARLPSELSYDFFFQQCQVHWCCQSRLVLPTCENQAGCRLVL